MNSPAITTLTLDEGPQRLWLEWLGAYFDGGNHVVAGASCVFPRATIGFDVADIGQPLSGVGIIVVAEDDRTERFIGATTGSLFVDVQWLVYIRGGIPGPGEGNSRHVCRHAAQLLRALLLDDDATVELARKGIMSLTPAREQVLPVNDNPVRLLRVKGQLQVAEA